MQRLLQLLDTSAITNRLNIAFLVHSNITDFFKSLLLTNAP